MKKINVLLVMPKVDIECLDWPIPPVGIAYVSSALKEKGFNVFCANLNLETDSVKKVLEREICIHNIDVVATGGLIVNYHTIKEILDIAKNIKPELITWVGGSLVTFSAEAVMKGIQSADIGMLGEGEYTACELLEKLEEGIDSMSDLESINGLIIRMENGELQMTPAREEIADIDELPWPDYESFHYFEMIRSFWNSEVTGIISATLTTSRSCPFCCTFCSKSGGEKYRQRNLDNIFSELGYLVEKYHVNRVLLNDELFANDKERIKEFCSRIKEYNVKWFVQLRVSRYITQELLQMMKDSGCIQIQYGLESGDNDVLRSMRKGITAEEIERVVHLTAEMGIQVKGNFIFGDPMETLETVQNTIKFIEKNLEALTSVALGPIILFPGSVLYKNALMDGTIEDELKFIEEECPIRNVSKMSNDEYHYVVNELLPRTKVKLNEIKEKSGIISFETDMQAVEYKFDYQCPCCGEKNSFYVNNIRSMMRSNQYVCNYCGKTLNISVTHEFALQLRPYLEKICQRYKTAFWGCGQNMIVFSEYMGGISDLEFQLIDMNEMKIGKPGIDGRIICSPDKIRELGIEFIIEMTSVRGLEILSRVQREFPEVKHVCSVFDIPLNAKEYL